MVRELDTDRNIRTCTHSRSWRANRNRERLFEPDSVRQGASHPEVAKDKRFSLLLLGTAREHHTSGRSHLANCRNIAMSLAIGCRPPISESGVTWTVIAMEMTAASS